MGTSKKSKNRKGVGYTEAKTRSVNKQLTDLHRQLRESSLALGAELAKIRQPDHRREQPVQGSEHKAVQGAQEAPKEL